MTRITTLALRSPWRGKERWLSDGGGWGAGRLMARILQDSIGFHYRYYTPDGRKRFLPLGPYDASGERGLTLPAARDRAAELAALYRSGVHDLHGYFERQREAEETARAAQRAAAARAAAEAQQGTLKQLLDTYVAHLTAVGEKATVSDVRSLFRTHVTAPFPELLERKAAAVSVDECVDVLGRVVAAGKGRTAAKLRSYLRAAYALAIAAKTDPSAPAVLKSFGISINPIASIGALSQFNRARHRHLAAPELGAFLRRLDAEAGSTRKDALEVAIALGGQRPTQLLRARAGDVDLAGGTITLYDPKGARDEPRVHVLPLTARALSILARRLAAMSVAGNGLVFGTDRETPLHLKRISEWVSDLSEAMVAAKESREPFQLRDLRRTLETLLASLGVSRDVRGQVQSHGLGGVQQRHYDRHEYLHEKRATLVRLEAHLAQLRAGGPAAALAAGPVPAPSAPLDPNAPAPRPDWAILPALTLTP